MKLTSMIKSFSGIALTLLFISSCSTYKMEVQQGNALSNETVSQLRQGMSKDEVLSMLGTPLLQDSFRNNRWDYVYFTKQGKKASKRQGITLLFKGDSLVKVMQ